MASGWMKLGPRQKVIRSYQCVEPPTSNDKYIQQYVEAGRLALDAEVSLLNRTKAPRGSRKRNPPAQATSLGPN